MIPLVLAAGLNKQVYNSNTTWNPADKGSGVTLSNGNLTATMTGGYGVRATPGHNSGKWYFETTLNQLDSSFYGPVIGVATAAAALQSGWSYGGEFTYYCSGSSSTLIYGANSRAAYGLATAAGDTIGITLDLDNKQMTFYKNGVSMGMAYNSSYITAGTYYPYISSPNGGGTTIITSNFSSSVKYPVSGFSPW